MEIFIPFPSFAVVSLKKGIQSIIGIQSTILVESDLYFTLEVELVRPITFA